MKTKQTCTLLLGLNLALAAAFAETDAAKPEQPAQPAVQPVAVQTTPAAAPAEAVTTPAIEAPVLAQADKPADKKEAPKAAEPAKETAPAGDVLPLILFEDAPLNDAIKTLARQAGINFQFDPKLAAAAAPGPDGKPAMQPAVSIRFENVTAQQALEAVLANHNLQMVPDSKTRTARITTKDPAAPPALITKVVQLKFASPTNLVNVIKPALTDKRSSVAFDGRTSKMIIVATEAEMPAIDSLIETLDAATRQVLIEARIYETARNPSSIKGIDWAGTFAAQNVSLGNNALPGVPPTTTTALDANGNPVTTTTPGTIGGLLNNPRLLWDSARGFNPSTAFLNADGVSAVVSFLNSDNDSQVVATPRAVTLDNEKALLSVTRSFPIINITPGSANSPAGSQILYTNLGTILEVTPRISANDMVQLRVVPEVSNFDGQDRQTINGQLNVANIFATRRIEANVMLPSGNTLVMGGLMSDSRTRQNNKVPVLGDAPGLGFLFRKQANDHKKSNLIIFVTPTIVRDSDYQPNSTEFLKTKLVDHPDAPKGWWQTADPHPWTQQQQQQQAVGPFGGQQ